MEELNRKIPQLPWIVAIVGIVIAGYFFLSASQVSTDIINCKIELETYNLKLEQYKKLEETYGRGSERYYANQPVLILKPEGDEGKITIYCGDIVDKTKQHAVFNKDTELITVKWADNWYGDKYNLIDLIVISGKNTGCYPITFTNNVNDDKFQILVVVK